MNSRKLSTMLFAHLDEDYSGTNEEWTIKVGGMTLFRAIHYKSHGCWSLISSEADSEYCSDFLHGICNIRTIDDVLDYLKVKMSV